MIASIVDCPVPNRLSNRCLVSASFTLTIGYFSAPSFAIARRRITPVVVSSVPPMISAIWSTRSLCNTLTMSAPSSIVMFGRMSSTALMCLKNVSVSSPLIA